MSKTDVLEIQVELGIDQPFEVVSCRIHEGISEVTHARIEVASMEDLDLERVLAEDAKILLLLDGIVERTWTLKVGKAHFLTAKNDSLRFSIELFSPEWLLRFSKDTRKFRKLSAQDIVTSVLTKAGLTQKWQVTRKTPRRNYCVQYRETNFDFVRRMLEFEGIFYTFDEDGTMVLSDRSSAAESIPGISHFELHETESALTDGAEGVHEIWRGARVLSGKMTANDFDWKKPDVRLIKSHEGERDTDLEFYDYPTGYRNAEDGEYLARIRLEALRAEARYVHGRSSVTRFAPARLFTFGPLAGAAFAGEYLLTRIDHTYYNPAYPAADTSHGGKYIYKNEFTAIPRDVPFRPAVTTPHPNIDGYHTAMVRGPVGEEIHTDKYGRFRAQFHWDREAVGTDDDSRWLRIVQESASSMFLARVGWEMNVAYIDGDPDRPIGLSRNINRVMPPAYGLPVKKNLMTIKTPTSPANGGYNEVRLDDSAGAQEFYIQAERDLLNIVKNDRSEAIGNNETRLVVGMLQETVERDQSVLIGANANIESDGMHQLRVQKDRSDTVGGNESIHTGSGMTVDVKGNDNEKVGSVRLTIAGSISPPNPIDRAKAALQGMVPDPKDAAKQVGKAAYEGGKQGAKEGGAKGAITGAAAGAKESIQSMIPKPPTGTELASSLTGGLSDGVTMDKLIDMFCTGSINRSGKRTMTRVVGGAQVSAALGNISTSANYGFTEIVGGAKLTIAAEGTIAQSVAGPLATTVGGLIMRTSSSDMSYSAENSFINVGATADLASDEKLKIQSDDTIELVADDEMKLTVGGVTITLTPSEIKFTGDLALKAKDKVVVTGKPDNVTK